MLKAEVVTGATDRSRSVDIRGLGALDGVTPRVWPSRSDRPPITGHVRGAGATSDRPPGGDKAITSTSASQRGFRHELLLHRSTQELVEFVVPIVREGVAAQEPTLLLVRPETAEAVLHQVGPSPYLTVQPALTEPGRRPWMSGGAPMLAGYARHGNGHSHDR